MKSFWSRRNLLRGAGAAWLMETFLPRQVYADYLAAGHGELYREIGIRPFINAAGTYTVLSGSVIPDRVREAMAEASRYFVPLVPLQNAVGERIAKLIGVEAALVSSGATASILLATAACVTGKDSQKSGPSSRPHWHEERSYYSHRAAQRIQSRSPERGCPACRSGHDRAAQVGD